VFGEQLKRARQARGLTQAELGASMEPPTSLYAVSLWELNKRRPDVEQLACLCRVLHVSADVLLERQPFEIGPLPKS
jgi:transcriptional regulator with XRE-family HTH domain